MQRAVSLTECFRSDSGGPNTLALSRYQVCFSEAKAARGMKLTTRLNLVAMLRMSKAWTQIIHMSLRRTQGQLTHFSAPTGPWHCCCYCCEVLGNCLPSATGPYRFRCAVFSFLLARTTSTKWACRHLDKYLHMFLGSWFHNRQWARTSSMRFLDHTQTHNAR